MDKQTLAFYSRLAKGIAAQFGSGCEVVVHDLTAGNHDHSIVAIENGHVTGRRVGDGPSHLVLEALADGGRHLEDRSAYLTKTRDGKILRSSMIFIRDEKDQIIGLLGINYDITLLMAMNDQLQGLIGTPKEIQTPASSNSMNVVDLLNELIEQSVRRIGKPAALMTKEDKVEVVRQLNDAGAFLITKSGPKVCQYLGISKYTLYAYLDEIKSGEGTV